MIKTPHPPKLLLAVVTLLPTFCFAEAAQKEEATAEKTNVLLFGGRGHDWRGFSNTYTKFIEATGDFQLTVSGKLDDLREESLNEFDVILFFGSGGNFSNPAQEHGLDQFVKNGGGFVGVHATDAFKKSDVYWHIIGGRFIGHGGGKFPIVLEDKEHPTTRGIEDFEIQDESYRDKFHAKAKLHTLGRINRGKEQHRMIWTQDYGKGRMWNTGLGHGKPAWNNPALKKLIIRSLYWTAKREVKDPK
jgi:type 1 glutamine amidotransferase